jgi:valyl-tRNA synthetase
LLNGRKVEAVDAALIEAFDRASATIMEVRRVRNEKQLAPKAPLRLLAKGNADAGMNPVISKLAFLEEIAVVNEAPTNAASFVIKGVEYFIPLEGLLDPKEEKEKLQKELEYVKGFLVSVEKKLSNERFVSGAPEQVLQLEYNKKADAESEDQSVGRAVDQFVVTRGFGMNTTQVGLSQIQGEASQTHVDLSQIQGEVS